PAHQRTPSWLGMTEAPTADWICTRSVWPRSAEAAQEADDAPHPRVGQTRGEIGKRRAFSNLGARRIRHHDTSERANVEALGDGQGPCGDQLAGTGADDGGAQDAPARVGYHLDMAHGFALGLGAVVLVIGPAQHPHLAPAAAPARLRLG